MGSVVQGQVQKAFSEDMTPPISMRSTTETFS